MPLDSSSTQLLKYYISACFLSFFLFVCLSVCPNHLKVTCRYNGTSCLNTSACTRENKDSYLQTTVSSSYLKIMWIYKYYVTYSPYLHFPNCPSNQFHDFFSLIERLSKLSCCIYSTFLFGLLQCKNSSTTFFFLTMTFLKSHGQNVSQPKFVYGFVIIRFR